MLYARFPSVAIKGKENVSLGNGRQLEKITSDDKLLVMSCAWAFERYV
jgi:hypothetical protein